MGLFADFNYLKQYSSIKGKLNNELFIEGLRPIYDKKDYVFFDGNKPFNLNIIGIRQSEEVNKFNDEFMFVYRDKKLDWQIDRFTGTTKPGITALNAPYSPFGCAIIKGGQTRGVWKRGKHKGKAALVQDKDFVIYRDNNKDGKYDFTNPQVSGPVGLNFHRMCNGTTVLRVNSWSAGCQGLNNPVHVVKALTLIDTAANIYGDYFSYTLFDLIRNE